MHEVGLAQADCVNWNSVPWYVSPERTNKNASGVDWKEATVWFDSFVRRLPELQVVVPMGRFAQRCWIQYSGRPRALSLPSYPCPHPGNLARVSNPHFEAEIRTAMIAAKRLLANPRSH
jgi:uracil-DNA glycosylase